MAHKKSKPAKKAKKALRKVAKKGPFVAALAVIAGEVIAAAKRARLDQRIVNVAQRAKQRLRSANGAANEPDFTPA